MIEFRCPQCDKRVRTREENRGKRAQCPKCQSIVRVPMSTGFLDDMNTEDFEHALANPPPLPALPVPADMIIVEDVPNKPPSRAFYATLAGLVGVLLLVVAFIAGNAWSATRPPLPAEAVATSVKAVEPKPEPANDDLLPPDKSWWPGTYPHEAFFALTQLVKQRLGSRATINLEDPREQKIVLVDKDANRYWFFRGDHLWNPDEATPEVDPYHRKPSLLTLGSGNIQDGDLGRVTFYDAHVWYQCSTQEWHLAYLSVGGIIVHDDTPKQLRRHVFSSFTPEEIFTLETSYSPTLPAIGIQRSALVELDRAR